MLAPTGRVSSPRPDGAEPFAIPFSPKALMALITLMTLAGHDRDQFNALRDRIGVVLRSETAWDV